MKTSSFPETRALPCQFEVLKPTGPLRASGGLTVRAEETRRKSEFGDAESLRAAGDTKPALSLSQNSQADGRRARKGGERPSTEACSYGAREQEVVEEGAEECGLSQEEGESRQNDAKDREPHQHVVQIEANSHARAGQRREHRARGDALYVVCFFCPSL
jgi:hypothetical protein